MLQEIRAQAPGRVLKIVTATTVMAGSVLYSYEIMKMEINYRAPLAGVFCVAAGIAVDSMIEAGQLIGHLMTEGVHTPEN